jgi:uncharacterized protein (UPF0548 family)
VFSLKRPTAVAIERTVATADSVRWARPRFLSVERGLIVGRLPISFARDFSQSSVGRGEAAFSKARGAFERWEMFNLGWVRVANATARIVAGQIVAVEAHTFGLWSLNFSRVLDAVDTPNCFGFLYATTEIHVEQGEERFLLEIDHGSGEVKYTVEAVSCPRSSLARLGYPITRSFQHRFARDSHRHMREVVSGKSLD